MNGGHPAFGNRFQLFPFDDKDSFVAAHPEVAFCILQDLKDVSSNKTLGRSQCCKLSVVEAIQTAAPGSEPQDAVVVFVDGDDTFVRKTAVLRGIGSEFAVTERIHAACIGTDPECALPVRVQTEHDQIGQPFFGSEVCEFSVLKRLNPLSVPSRERLPGRNRWTKRCCRPTRLLLCNERYLFCKAVDTASAGSGPDVAVCILIDGADNVVAESVAVVHAEKTPFCSRFNPPPFVPIHNAPARSSNRDQTLSLFNPSRVVNVVNFVSFNRFKPPPSNPIHRLPSRSSKSERTSSEDKPSAW